MCVVVWCVGLCVDGGGPRVMIMGGGAEEEGVWQRHTTPGLSKDLRRSSTFMMMRR